MHLALRCLRIHSLAHPFSSPSSLGRVIPRGSARLGTPWGPDVSKGDRAPSPGPGWAHADRVGIRPASSAPTPGICEPRWEYRRPEVALPSAKRLPGTPAAAEAAGRGGSGRQGGVAAAGSSAVPPVAVSERADLHSLSHSAGQGRAARGGSSGWFPRGETRVQPRRRLPWRGGVPGRAPRICCGSCCGW